MVKLSEAGVQLEEKCGDPEEVAAYVARYPAYRQRMAALWAAARDNFPRSKSLDIRKIRDRHNLRLDVSLDRWQRGPGRLVGSIGTREIEQAFNPSSVDAHSCTSRGRVFKGRHWGEVLVVPFFDLPDRIRAFMFLGRQGRVHLDQVFRSLASISFKFTEEAGLAGIESIAMAGDPSSVIATDDYLLGLQAQMRTFRGSSRPLPLVVWRDDGKYRTHNAWTMLGGKRVVFWTRELDHRVIMQAVETDGRLSFAGPVTPDRAAMLHYLRLRPGADLERTILGHAKPWPEALKLWMDKAPDGKVQDLTLRLEQAGADVSYIFRQLGTNKHATRITPKRSIQYGKAQIVEENDQLYATSKRAGRRELLNAVLRLAYAIKDRESGEVYYRGSIRFKGEDIQFIEKLDVVRLKTVDWLQAKLLDVNAGILAVGLGSFNFHQIAVLFQEPKFVVDDLYKWVERMRAGQEDAPTLEAKGVT